MITKANTIVAVEGLVVDRDEGHSDRLTRRRVEIDSGTGLIRSVGDPEGDADLVLGDDHRIFPGFIDVHVHAGRTRPTRMPTRNPSQLPDELLFAVA
jgi:cytosine/adenosine deaminase-related metal-dependent hydrolase